MKNNLKLIVEIKKMFTFAEYCRFCLALNLI